MLPLVTALSPNLLADSKQTKIFKMIPSSGEMIPCVGMGSSRTFNIDTQSEKMSNLSEVLQLFFESGGRVLDSSPMYGKAEAVLGEIISRIKSPTDIFAASKIWTDGKQEGIDAVEKSRHLMKVAQMDLMQVHNLRDWKIHIPTLQTMKKKQQIRYTGITTSSLRQYAEFEQVMQSQQLDFVQLNYNIEIREAEKKLLPLALDKGMAVMVNRPYNKGKLFKKVRGKDLPEWSKEFGCESWGQFFLKFILSHPAVTCVIPATSKIHHMKDNMAAMTGELPDLKTRQKMIALFDSL